MNMQEILKNVENSTIQDVKSFYLNSLRASRIEPIELLQAEMLDLSAIGKDVERNLRAIQRSDEEFCGLYFHISPSAKWSLNIGLLPFYISQNGLSQEQLFFSQKQTIPCRSNEDAASLYFYSRRTPCAEAMMDYLIALTIAEIYKAVMKANLRLEVYVGISHDDSWIRL